ncbi:MAG: amino acid racemase [Ignavibacteriales bacterium]|nr:amino acid racemase [Ignavibacteriales bacterium]
MQKVIGIIGGIAPPSTIDYYQKIISGFQEKGKTRQYPSILINSIDMTRMLDLVAKKWYDALVDYLSSEIQKLKDGGADFAAIASNTPHVVFEQLQKRSAIPLISIVDVTVAYAIKLGVKKLGLFGTMSTMQSGFYQAGFSREGIEIITPSLESQNYIHDKYMNEFVKGIFLEETKNAFIDIVLHMIKQNSIEGLILGGTELPFILKEEDFINFKLLNTTEIHVDSILEYAMNYNNHGMK